MDRPNGAPGPAPGPSRAERFEDEKRRIIESCFHKKDPDGSSQETYITHIRITEYSSHPATPPPPQARTPESEKPRVIIISVRKSGRVRMHKSKENINGTFSIGKTWNLDDLSHIESFTSPQANPNHREWAGDTGFLVILGKPYFWQAQTDKEKKFFIASMIKIYGKYTRGKFPELSGFDQKEMDQVMGAGKRPAQPPGPGPGPGPGPPPRPPFPAGMQSQQSNMSAQSSISTLASEVPPRNIRTPPVRNFPSATNSPTHSFDSTNSRDNPRAPPQRKFTHDNKSQDSFGPPKPEDPSSIPPRSRNGMPGQPPPGRFGPREAPKPPGQPPSGRFGDPREPPVPPGQPVPSRFGEPREPSAPPMHGRFGDRESPGPPSRPPSQPLIQPREPPSQALPQPLRMPSENARPPSRAREEQPPPRNSRPPSQPRDDTPLYGATRPPSRPREEQPPLQNPRPPSRPREEPAPPERRRPPMDPTRPQDRDLVPPPLSPLTPGEKAAGQEVTVPPRSSDRMSPRKVSAPQKVPAALSIGPQDRNMPPPSLVPGPPAKPEPKAEPKAVIKSEPKPEPTPPSPLKPEPPRRLGSIPPPSPPKTDTPPPAAPETETPSPPSAPTQLEEEARPGLGPMIKSKKSRGDVAGAFWKAASAATAFKPRPGGAGARLLQAAQKTVEGPDGITSVVPAPPKPAPREPSPEPPAKAPARTSIAPEVKVTVPKSQTGTSQAEPQEVTKDATAAKKSTEEVAPHLPPRRSVVAQDHKYLRSLGIDPKFLDGRSDQYGQWLDHFGWVPGEQMRNRNAEDMKTDLERELNKAQAGGWLARFQEEDERVDAIKKGIDVAMTECEEMDNLLTLYSVELSTLSEDIAYIEAQGQGLQVQTANQKLLKKELESLLETCAITSNDLEALRLAPLDNVRGLEDAESTLVTLFKAQTKIDPSFGGNESNKANATLDSDQTAGLNSDYGKMRIVQEKQQMYNQESNFFIHRLLEFMPRQFEQSFTETKRALDGALSKKVDASHHEAGRDGLWKYSPLMLYVRDADQETWGNFFKVYQDLGAPLYKSEFQHVIQSWRNNARKMTGEEAELLFTSQVEKQQENVATTARKLTVKRSQTLARALRSPLSDGSKPERQKEAGGGRSFPYEVFAGVLDDLLPLVEMEQNFIIDFFHATTLEQADFPDAVAACRPRDRRGGDLRRHRLMEPDRDVARRVTRAMEALFVFLDQELQRLMEWVIAQDPLQGVGVFVTIEKKMADISQTNQDFINTIFQKQHGLLGGRFRKFVDDQIRAIEETKVKIHKRKGVIHFIRVFPAFSTAIENMLSGIDPNLAIRRTVDREYDRILKSMFDSLLVIARENPAVGVSTSSADPEDKEALNFHILLIENMNHFAEETDTKGLEVLEIWKENANTEYTEHMALYLAAVMRRPLGKLLDTLENIEAQLASGKSAPAIVAQPSNSKDAFNKVLGNYDSKEVRKGIEALRKRVEKHFGDEEQGGSSALVGKVWGECEGYYSGVDGRIGRIVTDVYGGDVLFEWPRADVKAAFR